uniref:Protein-tyrosine-phosphatase n=1 Tax=Anopheles melas TaxID=34690 RepID=A0A182TUK1_9DIPT
MLDAIVYNGCTHRLLRLGVALVFVSTLVELLAASPTTVYDSYGDNRALPVRVDDRSSGGSFFSTPQHSPLSAQQGAGETLPPVQQQLLVGGGGGVTRVPWYGLTELSDVLLLGVLVTVAVLGTLLFVVLVLGLRAKLQLLRQDRAAAGDDRAELAADYAQECSAIKCVGSGGKGKVIKTPPASPPILLLEAGAVVKPVPTTCIAVTGVDGGRRRTEQHLNQSDKRHRSPGGRGSKRRPPPVASGQPLPVATVNMSASIGATASIDPATSSASGRETTEHVTIDDKDRHHRGQPRAEQGEEQQQQPVSPLPSAPPPSDKRNVLKRQAVAELSVFAGLPAPGTPGSGSPTAYLQLLTPLSASSLSTSAATTDNNATPTKGEPGGGSATGGGPLSAAESMAAARFGFSPRSIHSFTMQTATYFRFPDVDDFTPTPRTLPKRHGGAGGDETCSTPPAVDARTEEEEEEAGGQLRRTERDTAAPKVAVLAPSPGSMPLPPSPPAKGNPKEGEVTQDVVAAIVEQMEQLQAPLPPPPPASTSIEPHRSTARICAPMANRRVRLKSISLDSEGARLVEENLTSTIPVQELVGMAAHRTGGFDCVIDDDDDDEEDNERDDDDEDDDGHDERANASAAHDETDEDEDEAAAAAKQRSAARAKRVRNILNLRLNIPPLPTGGGTGSMATQGRPPPPGASQSTGSVAKPIVKTVTVTGGGATANGNRKEKKSPLGLKAMGGCGGEGGTTPTQSQSPSEQGGKQDDGTKPSVPTSGRSSILQRRGSNHSLTLNLDVYNRSGGSVDLTSSSCTSLYRGSYKNLHQVQSHTQLYQPAHQHPVEPPVRVQCHQASPQQPAPGSATAGDGTTTTSGTMHNNNNNSNGSNANTSKKNLLQRRGSNTSLTLNLRSGVGACGGTGSTFGLNRFSSHNSLNTGMASALGASNSHQHHSQQQQQQQQYHQQQHQQHQQQFPSSSMVRLAGSRKSLLERRNSNASLTLINVNQRTLSVSNCNLRGSICSLNSLLTTHTQNEPGPSDMMLEEDELDGNGDNDHHHYHHHHHHHNHHHHHHGQHGGQSGPHHGGLHRGGGEGELRRFGSSVDAPFTGTDGAGVQSEMGRAGSRYNQAHERSEQQHHQHLHHAVGGGGGGGHHEESRSARQRKFRSSDSLHNINVREQGLHGGHGAAGSLQTRLMDADSKLMSGSGYPQCSCQSSFDERHHYGSSENFKEHQNKLSIHRGLFQRDPATVTSTSSANNLSALGTGTMYSGCCCPCCCGCCGCCGGVAGIGSHLDGCCGVSGPLKAGGNLSSSNSNVRNISTKPLSPQTTSEDFKIYLANIQFLQNASNVLTMAYLRKLHNFFTKTYRKMVAATATVAQEAFQHQQKEDAAHKDQHESTKADGEAATTTGTKMMLLHSDSLHHPPVCDDESYEEEHKRMVLKIHQEFWDLPTNYQEKPLVFGSQAKNRYKTILPNEHSRVILEPERSPAAGGEPYINANYIKVRHTEQQPPKMNCAIGPDYANNSYIATQGPLPNTIYEFWLMVYQNVARTATVAGRSCASAGLEQKIVMLTNFVENGRQKCAIYFPQTADEWVAFGSGADIDVGEMLREKDTITASIAAAEQQQQPEGQEAVGGVCQPVTVRVHCASCFFLVHNVAVEQRNGYTVRTLNVIYGAKVSDADAPDGDGSRALFELKLFRAHHYWFPDWPDHRSPKDINVLLDLSLDVLGSNVVDTPRPESSNSLKGNQPGTPGLEEVMGAAQLAALSSSCTPTVLPIVHCSAGIGRTGCLIAILNGLRQLRLSVMAHQRKQQQFKQSQAQAGEAGHGELQSGGSKSAADRMQDELEQSLPLPPVPDSGPEGRRKSTVQMDGATLLAPNAAVGRGGQREGSAVVRESGQVDILGIVCNLRLQRGGMVQNSEQYELIHRALCLYLEKLTQDGQI